MRSWLVAIATVLFGIGTADAEIPSICGGSPANNRPDFDMQLRTALPRDDYFDVMWKCQHPPVGFIYQPSGERVPMPTPPPPPPPASQWISADRAMHVRMLAKTPVDVVVVPFQVQGFGIDRIERAIMTADLAYEIGQSTTTADPFLVARAFGEGSRRIESIDVRNLAEQLKSRVIVTGYVGHENRNALTLSFHILEMKGNAIVAERKKDWVALPFTHENPPFMVFHRLLPEIVRDLAIVPTIKPAAAVQVPTEFVPKVNQSPTALIQGAKTTLSPIQSSLLLAALVPPTSERASERLNIRAFLSALRSKSTSPLIRFAEAYALMNLEHRPAALEMLNGLSTPRDRALTALLNGNFPAAESARNSITNSFERLLIDMRLNDLRETYGREGGPDMKYVKEMFGGTLDAWGPTLSARYSDGDSWQVQESAEVKTFLDEVFPVPELSLESRLQGNAVLKKSEFDDEIDIDLLSARHIRQILERQNPAPCCQSNKANSLLNDGLVLAEGELETRIAKDLDRTSRVHGLPDDAISSIQRYAPIFDGHPVVEAAKAQAALDLYKKAAADARAHWRQMIDSTATSAARHSHGQSKLSLESLIAMGLPSAGSLNVADAYGYDYPRREYWVEWFFGVDFPKNRPMLMTLMNESLAYSRTRLHPLRSMSPYLSDQERSDYATKLADRFIGMPNRESAFRLPGEVAPAADRLANLRAAISSDPEEWSNYETLGKLLFVDGKFEDYAKLFQGFPGFKPGRTQNRVLLSNRANSVASPLYWHGMPDLARPFLKIAADTKTGSEASMMGEIKLQIIDGDFTAAAAASVRRAQRYGSAFAYQDYFSILHALGQGKEAWLGFAQIQVAEPNDLPAAWVSALVGQRKDGADEKAIRKWLFEPSQRNAKYRKRTLAPWYAIMANSVDRMPPLDLGKLVAELDPEPRARITGDGMVAIPVQGAEDGFVPIQPSDLRRLVAPRLPANTPVQSDFVYFAEAYALLRQGQYAKSVEAFVKMADRYQIESGFAYAFGYYAYAASKIGDTTRLEQYLKVSRNEKSYDQWLASAFIAASKKDADAAYAALSKAFSFYTDFDRRPILNAYQYAEACEWLYKDTGDKRFLDLLLNWVKQHQRIEPTHAWAYAMQYEYATDAEVRSRALAMTQYLDRLSPRIAKASQEEVTKARAWFKDHNPFKGEVEKPRLQASLY